MDNKYNIEFTSEDINANIIRLTNQLWKLIPMRENNENWEKQLEIVIIEIAGLKELFLQNPRFLQLLSKLEGLKVSDLDFASYRRTVFESINLIQGYKL